jgi:hypothetical protein
MYANLAFAASFLILAGVFLARSSLRAKLLPLLRRAR